MLPHALLAANLIGWTVALVAVCGCIGRDTGDREPLGVRPHVKIVEYDAPRDHMGCPTRAGEYDHARGEVRIERRLTPEWAVRTFLHELAHRRSGVAGDEHGPAFARELRRVEAEVGLPAGTLGY
jgi:hypothetical protein